MSAVSTTIVFHHGNRNPLTLTPAYSESPSANLTPNVTPKPDQMMVSDMDGDVDTDDGLDTDTSVDWVEVQDVPAAIGQAAGQADSGVQGEGVGVPSIQV